MGVYSPEEYFKNLYPGWFTETNLAEIIFLVLLFTLLMLVFGYFIQIRRHKIGDEIYCGKFFRDNTYNIKIIKTKDDEWLAIKINMDTMERTMLRRGELSKVMDYINRNFGLKFDIVKK